MIYNTWLTLNYNKQILTLHSNTNYDETDSLLPHPVNHIIDTLFDVMRNDYARFNADSRVILDSTLITSIQRLITLL